VTCLFDGLGDTQKKTTAPGTARWSIEHWESAF
jgi:hypothetical protein